MPENTLSTDLRAMVDEIATRLVLGGYDGPGAEMQLAELSQTLLRIGSEAESAGLSHVAAISARMAESVSSAGCGDALHRDLLSMQEALAETSKPQYLAISADPELLADFVSETREHLTNIEVQALAVEANPLEVEAVHSLFRSFHTIKGLAGFLEIPDIQQLSHEVEAILDLARNGKLRMGSAVIDAILQSADYLKRRVDELHGGAACGGRDTTALVQTLQRLPHEGENQETPDEARAETPDEAQDPAAAESGAAPSPSSTHREMSVKVDTAKLDYLADMVGEMVIAQSIIRHDPDLATLKAARLTRNLAQLGRITAEIQKTAMSMRLVPIGNLFRRMTRLVRDLSRKCGKQVQCEVHGEGTEMDRTLVEELADPLMHMVRNAVDHGIEAPDSRLAAGKEALAKVVLRSYHQAGHIVVELADDGKGLDRERILRKARERGLVTEGLSDQEIWQLICAPGFSTAEKVTDVSGRGVGMDVVRKQIQKLRGTMEIRSAAGKGTTFVLKLPLTLAIIDGLVVSVGAERYIVPLFVVRETFRPAADTIFTVQGKAEMALVRGELLPITRLHRRFGVDPKAHNPYEGILIVAEVENHRFGLLVDELIGKQEVVIKSLGEAFRNVAGVAGGAILGDGRVGLILDFYGLIDHF